MMLCSLMRPFSRRGAAGGGPRLERRRPRLPRPRQLLLLLLQPALLFRSDTGSAAEAMP